MSTTTINITLPTRLKKEIQNQIKKGMYTSVSEFIRNAVRQLLVSSIDGHNLPFSPQAEKEILKAFKETLENRDKNIVLKSEKDIDAFFKNL